MKFGYMDKEVDMEMKVGVGGDAGRRFQNDLFQ